MSTKSSWGQTRRGRSPLTAALITGVLATLTVTCITFALNDDAQLSLALGAATLMPSMAIGWLAVVEPSSITGSTRAPQFGVESSWYDRATRGAFHDALIGMGLALLALAMVPALKTTSPSLVLALALIAITLDVATRYHFLARREG